MLGIKLGVADRSNPGVDEGSGMILSCGSFGVTFVGNKLEYLMVKCWVLHSELKTKENLGVMNDKEKPYQVARLREGHL